MLASAWPWGTDTAPRFMSKWLGVPWSIEIRRDGTKVAEQQVRGWRRSGRRIDELTQAAAAGALSQ